jgi:hypothetical protein
MAFSWSIAALAVPSSQPSSKALGRSCRCAMNVQLHRWYPYRKQKGGDAFSQRDRSPYPRLTLPFLVGCEQSPPDMGYCPTFFLLLFLGGWLFCSGGTSCWSASSSWRSGSSTTRPNVQQKIFDIFALKRLKIVSAPFYSRTLLPYLCE